MLLSVFSVKKLQWEFQRLYFELPTYDNEIKTQVKLVY